MKIFPFMILGTIPSSLSLEFAKHKKEALEAEATCSKEQAIHRLRQIIYKAQTLHQIWLDNKSKEVISKIHKI